VSEVSGDSSGFHLKTYFMLQKSGIKQAAIRSLVLVAVCATMFSFSPGGDSFTIYLNDKVMIRQYVTPEASARTLALNEINANDVLKVHYNHCGKTGIKRSMAVQDSRKKILKTWHFSDNTPALMELSIKEVVAFRKDAGPQGLQLVYSSVEIPEGMVLASITMPDEGKASLN
jgi:hypothetical protein